MGSSLNELLVAPPPGLAFDPIDAVISFQSRLHLEARLAAYRRHLAGDPSTRLSQDAILRRFPTEIAARLPRYAGLQPRTFDEIPFISKDDLRRDPRAFIDASIRRAWYKDTSGTTGGPVRIFYSADSLFEQRFLDLPKILTLRDEPTEVPGVCCVQITDTVTTHPAIYASPIEHCRIQATLNIGDPRWVDQLTRLKPRFVSSRPELLEEVSERLANVCLPLKALLSAGSALTTPRRRAIEGAVGVSCVDVYALSEFGTVAFECACGALHLDCTSILAEVIDEHGKILSTDTSGELVLSSLGNTVQPLLRYRTGDQAALSIESCSCGKPGPVLRLTEGRIIPTFRFAAGVSVTPTCFNDLAHRWALEEYQITQSGPDRVDVLLEPSSVTPPDVVDEVGQYVRRLLPNEVRVEVRPFTFSRTVKRQRYVVRVPALGTANDPVVN